MSVSTFPLTWPHGQVRVRADERRHSTIKIDFGHTRDGVLHALRLLGARHVVVSSNVALRRDGLPIVGTDDPGDPGVAIYFERCVLTPEEIAWRPFVIACDRYVRIGGNLFAIAGIVGALQLIQRHGASAALERAFAGYAAPPPPPARSSGTLWVDEDDPRTQPGAGAGAAQTAGGE